MFDLLTSMGSMEGMGGSEGLGGMGGINELLTKEGGMDQLLKNPNFLKEILRMGGYSGPPPILTKGWKNRQAF